MEHSSFEVLECIKQSKPRFVLGTTSRSSTTTLSVIILGWRSSGIAAFSLNLQNTCHHWGLASIERNRGKTFFASPDIISYLFSKVHDEGLNL